MRSHRSPSPLSTSPSVVSPQFLVQIAGHLSICLVAQCRRCAALQTARRNCAHNSGSMPPLKQPNRSDGRSFDVTERTGDERAQSTAAHRPARSPTKRSNDGLRKRWDAAGCGRALPPGKCSARARAWRARSPVSVGHGHRGALRGARNSIARQSTYMAVPRPCGCANDTWSAISLLRSLPCALALEGSRIVPGATLVQDAGQPQTRLRRDPP